MKRIIAILLAIFLFASTFMLLTACSSDDDGDNTKATTQGTTTPSTTENASVSEAEWKAAFGSFGKIDFVLEIDSFDENNVSMKATHTVNQKAQMLENEYQDEELVYYVVEDGMIVEYEYDFEAEVWDREEYAEYTEAVWLSTYNYAAEGLIIDEVFLPGSFDYKSFSYDAKNGKYICEELDINYPEGTYYGTMADIEVTFVDGKLCWISYDFLDKSGEGESLAFEVKISCADEDVKITVPEFTPLASSDPEISESEWKDLFSLDRNAYQLKVDYKENGEILATMAQDVYGDIIKTVEMSGGAIAIDYMEKAEGGYYYYNDETESGDINAARTYKKMFRSLEDTHGEDEFESNRTGPENMFKNFDECFSKFTYDSAKGCYFAEVIDEGITNVSVYVVDGNLARLVYNSGATAAYEIDITYEDTPIALPTVE